MVLEVRGTINLRPFTGIFFLKKTVRHMFRAKDSMKAIVVQLLVDLMNTEGKRESVKKVGFGCQAENLVYSLNLFSHFLQLMEDCIWLDSNLTLSTPPVPCFCQSQLQGSYCKN
jgi:hypothetical protein